MLFTFLVVIQAAIAFALVTVILLQRSEGGALGTGGSPSSLMSARGAANFLTRATSMLATGFVVLSIVLAFLAAGQHRATAVDTSLVGKTVSPASAPDQTAPAGDALSGAAATAGAATASNSSAPASGGSVPLAQ